MGVIVKWSVKCLTFIGDFIQRELPIAMKEINLDEYFEPFSLASIFSACDIGQTAGFVCEFTGLRSTVNRRHSFPAVGKTNGAQSHFDALLQAINPG